MKIRLALLVTVAFLAPVAAQSYSELLQRAIYLQETRGDLEGAVRLYRQIASQAPPASDARAQAVERLQALQAARPASADARGGLKGRMYRHAATGLILELPDGWEYQATDPSSDNGEMVTMSSADPKASISLWLIAEQNDWGSLNARLDASPDMKVENRISMGMSDYRLRPGSRQRVTIAGNQAMVAIGDFTGAEGPMEEYLVWIYTEKTHTFFFSMVPAGQLARLKPQFDALLNSTIIP